MLFRYALTAGQSLQVYTNNSIDLSKKCKKSSEDFCTRIDIYCVVEGIQACSSDLDDGTQCLFRLSRLAVRRRLQGIESLEMLIEGLLDYSCLQRDRYQKVR